MRLWQGVSSEKLTLGRRLDAELGSVYTVKAAAANTNVIEANGLSRGDVAIDFHSQHLAANFP